MSRRLSIYIVLGISFFLMPWWVTMILAITAVFVVPLFYEGVLVIVFILAAFTGAEAQFIFLGVLAAILTVFLVENLIKPRVAWYDEINKVN